MNEVSSKRIRNANFILTIFIVMLHSSNLSFTTGAVKTIFSFLNVIFDCAVPFFS